MNYYEFAHRIVLFFLRKLTRLNYFLVLRSEAFELRKRNDYLDWE